MLLNKLSMSEVLMLASILEKDNAWKRVAGQFHIDPAIHLKKYVFKKIIKHKETQRVFFYFYKILLIFLFLF